MSGFDADGLGIFQFHPDVDIGVFAASNLDNGQPWLIAGQLLAHKLHALCKFGFDITKKLHKKVNFKYRKK